MIGLHAAEALLHRRRTLSGENVLRALALGRRGLADQAPALAGEEELVRRPDTYSPISSSDRP